MRNIPKPKSLRRTNVPKFRKPRRRKVLRTEAAERIDTLTGLIKSNQKMLRRLNYGKNPEPREVAFLEQKIAGFMKDRKVLKADTGRTKFIYLSGGAKCDKFKFSLPKRARLQSNP